MQISLVFTLIQNYHEIRRTVQLRTRQTFWRQNACGEILQRQLMDLRILAHSDH